MLITFAVNIIGILVLENNKMFPDLLEINCCPFLQLRKNKLKRPKLIILNLVFGITALFLNQLLNLWNVLIL